MGGQAIILGFGKSGQSQGTRQPLVRPSGLIATGLGVFCRPAVKIQPSETDLVWRRCHNRR